jgi:hypothetical protein
VKRIKALATENTLPQNRLVQEIAAYRDVLNTIHIRFKDIPLTTNIILQLHRNLFKYSEADGNRKSVDNEILEQHPNGIHSFQAGIFFRHAGDGQHADDTI